MRVTNGKTVAKDPDALAWWDLLNTEEWQRVVAWCRENPPPSTWIEQGFTRVDWAFTEMPFAPDGRT